MAHPKRHDGWFRFNNEIAEALSKHPLTSTDLRFLMWFIRNTWGRGGKEGKKDLKIKSMRSVSRELNMDHSNLNKAFKAMIKSRILVDIGNKTYRLNKDYESWGVVEKPHQEGDGVWSESHKSVVEKPQGVVEMPQKCGRDATPLYIKDRKTPIKRQKDTQAVEKTNGTKTPPPHVEFVERFRACYESVTKAPFQFDKKQFILSSRLIKLHGYDTVVEKAKILGVMCRDRSIWFTRDGWGSFSIEKLSNRWNEILPKHIYDPEAKKRDEFMKIKEQVRADHERLNSIANTARRT